MRTRLSTVRVRRGLSETQRFLLLSIVIGITAGLLVVCFHITIELIAWWTEDAATSPLAALAIPALGAVAATAIARYVVPQAGGSGIVQTKLALHEADGRIPFWATPGKFLSCSVSLGTGTPLGPEDPSLLMGAGVASMIGRTFGLSRQSMRLLAPIGAAAGIAAAFNTPITGVLFVIEEVIAAWNGTVLGSIVLAAVAAVVTTRVFLGDAPLFGIPNITAIADLREVLVYALLGLACGLLAVLYVRGMTAFHRRLGAHAPLVSLAGPCCAGLLVGIAALWMPEVLGPGYGAIESALHNQFTLPHLIVLGLIKLLLVQLAFGTGTPGGLFAPTLFIGAMAGGAAGMLAGAAPFAVGTASAYVLAGMGAFFGGVFRAPMTSIFMVFEVSATYVVIVPAMIASTIAYLVSRSLQPTSLLDLVALHEGTFLPSAQMRREAEPLRVEDALRQVPVLDAAAPAGVARQILSHPDSPAVLVRLDATSWAAVDRHDLEATAGANLDTMTLAQLAGNKRVEPLHPDESLDTALRRLAHYPVLPVVSRRDAERLVGALTLADVHRAYGIAASTEATRLRGD
jgi:CIC family chloride channel protein